MTAPALPPKPFTPQSLAARWDCSAEKIRAMVRAGDLRAARLGPKLIRIPVSEVERIECQTTASPCTAANSPSHGTNQGESIRDESRLARLIADRPNLSPVRYGTG